MAGSEDQETKEAVIRDGVMARAEVYRSAAEMSASWGVAVTDYKS